jgi:hypothetical protein
MTSSLQAATGPTPPFGCFEQMLFNRLLHGSGSACPLRPNYFPFVGELVLAGF